MRQINDLKVALVHDFLLYQGGAERVLEALSELFPKAPIYTLLCNHEKMKGKFSGHPIRTSFLQKFPGFLRRHHKWLLPLMPVAPETFDLREYDLVISSSGAWSKAVVTRLDTLHISYTHSPMRFAWDWTNEYINEQKKGKVASFFMRLILNYLRIWDFQAADRADYFIANSKYTQARIKKFYRQESAVIYPPIGSKFLNPSMDSFVPKEKNYFLIVGRISPYKNVEATVEAFNKLGLSLVIIGTGSAKNIKNIAQIIQPNIILEGFLNDEKLIGYYQHARALICASVEDFGLNALEALSQGTPVIALNKGGFREIVREGVDGEFFDAAKMEIIADGVRRFMKKENQYDKQALKRRAQEFSKDKFKREIKEFIGRIL